MIRFYLELTHIFMGKNNRNNDMTGSPLTIELA